MLKTIRNHIGINITTSKLQLVEVAYVNGEFLLENVSEELFVEYLDFNDTHTKVVSLLQDAFNKIIMNKPLTGTTFSFTLPHNLFQITQLPVENSMLESDMKEHFRWEYSLLFPELNLDELVLQFIKTDNENSSAIISGISKKYILLLKKFCDQNSADLKFVDNVHFASDNLIKYESNLLKKPVILSLYLSNDLLSIDLLKNHRPVQFQISTVNSQDEIISVTEKFIRMNNFLNNDYSLISGICISGEANFDSLKIDLMNKFKTDVFGINPFDKIRLSDNIRESKIIRASSGTFSAAAGIAFRIIS